MAITEKDPLGYAVFWDAIPFILRANAEDAVLRGRHSHINMTEILRGGRTYLKMPRRLSWSQGDIDMIGVIAI